MIKDIKTNKRKIIVKTAGIDIFPNLFFFMFNNISFGFSGRIKRNNKIKPIIKYKKILIFEGNSKRTKPFPEQSKIRKTISKHPRLLTDVLLFLK